MSSPLSTDSEVAADQLVPSPSPEPKQSGGLAGPFRFGDFRLLFAGQLVSVFGDMFYAVAMPWYMLSSGGGPANLGIVLTGYGIPRIGTTLLGGWLSDRLRPRRVMLLSDIARACILGALAAVVLLGHPPLTMLVALAVVLGAFDGMFFPATSAIAPDILPEETLQAGNALSFAWTQLATLLGPGIAGIIVARFAPGVAFAVDAGTFVVSTVTLALMRAGRARAAARVVAKVETPAGTTEVADQAVADATPPITITRFILATPYFQALLVILVAANFLNGCVGEIALPVLAHGPLHSGATGYGAILAAFGGGALVGGLLAGTISGRVNRGVYAITFFFVQALVILALAFAPTTLVAAILMGLFGLLNGLGNVTFITLVQRKLPRHLLGRIMGLFAFTNFGLYPLSVAVGGFAVTRFGPGVVILGGGLINLVAILSAYLVRDLREL